jgi:hypothetical protein
MVSGRLLGTELQAAKYAPKKTIEVNRCIDLIINLIFNISPRYHSVMSYQYNANIKIKSISILQPTSQQQAPQSTHYIHRILLTYPILF